VVELKRRDIKTLIALVSQEIDRIGAAREKHGFYDSSHFYQLIDMRNKLLAMPSGEEPSSSISDEEWQELLRGKGVK